MVRPPFSAAASSTRSRVTNGSDLLVGIDGRSALARRYRDLIEALSRQIGGQIGETESLQIRAAAALQLHVEALTARVVRGEAVDPEAITRASNGAMRALAALKRSRVVPRAKPGREGLATYLASKGGQS